MVKPFRLVASSSFRISRLCSSSRRGPAGAVRVGQCTSGTFEAALYRAVSRGHWACARVLTELIVLEVSPCRLMLSDVDIVQPALAVLDAAVAISEGALARTTRFNLCSDERDAGLEVIEDLICMITRRSGQFRHMCARYIEREQGSAP